MILKDNPLHVSLFPPHMDSTMEFSFLLNSCLDIFDIRQKQTSIDQDLGLLQALDERLAAYGWLTNTGIKFIVIVDLIGQPVPIGAKEPKRSAIAGLRDSDLKPVRPAFCWSFAIYSCLLFAFFFHWLSNIIGIDY